MESSVWNMNRAIQRRIIVQGNLILESPAHMGGDPGLVTDMPLSLDAVEQRALLPGTSLAGALRSYLRQRELGYSTASEKTSLDQGLFGSIFDNEGDQSYLIVSNALSIGGKPAIELRDGVMLELDSRTAKDDMKFDFEVLQAGLVFPLRFELLLPTNLKTQARLLQAFCIALQGLERGEIALGARKHRGFGKCQVSAWQVNDYDLTRPAGLIAWLNQDTRLAKNGDHIAGLLDVETSLDSRRSLQVEGTFKLAGPLLIRSNPADAKAPDSVHLATIHNGKRTPIISGTSIAGALRSQMTRIARTLELPDADALVDGIFGKLGKDEQDETHASRIWVEESKLSPGNTLVQNRVKIDRFTGGAYPTALFNQQPLFAEKTDLKISLRLENPTPAENGLLLLAVKDLWLSDLPLGGESSIGRGRLLGQELKIDLHTPESNTHWHITGSATGELAITGDAAELESFVTALNGGAR
jgi:CRISPR/Cas system CSM-associated protein Csm3 (group 7 of RAMP superfamily)